MKLDFHIHSSHSKDAVNKPSTIIKIAKKQGIGITITDHENIKAWKELKELGKKSNVLIVLGEEVKVFDESKKIGEFLCLFLQEEICSRNYLEAIDEVKAQDGMVFVAHPFDLFRNHFKKLKEVEKKVDGIEAFNARSFLSSFNKKAINYAKQNGLCMIAGSDAHTPKEIGNGLTEIKANNLEEIKQELRKKRTSIKGIKSPFSVHFYTQLANWNLLRER